MGDLIICVDFDGTCVLHEYPKVGADVPNAVRTLKDLSNKGHQLILWTMRSGKELDDAIQWFNDREIPLWDVGVNPEQYTWTTSRKCYANLYIDDAGFNAPLICDGVNRPYLDWLKVREYFELDEK